ncbi:AAA family ATPase [Eggerthella guodeyinii]|uniref:AAA family ATPase n=1 Tax=Eggerthella guodeyinii TaxID=2690837 RepID=A0A6L7IXJ0_9ACTN|nr:AAA family ATPase [Eggerthella guodeyinii]QOS67357.1 AAA family ATPase [Eggerthella guodeyinii]
MTKKQVECVWIWQYNPSIAQGESSQTKPTSIQKAVYGRFSGNTYTKDYLQFATNSLEVETIFELVDGRTNVEYKWIGGTDSTRGSIEKSSDRFHLKWTAGDIPECFMMSPNPTTMGPRVIKGDPGAKSSLEADKILEEFNLEACRTDSIYFLFVIKLYNEDNTLHLRTYIENPPEGLEQLSISRLPSPIQNALSQLKGSRSKMTACVPFDKGININDPMFKKALDLLSKNPNLLLVGPPGTGKTVLLNKLRTYIANGITTFDTETQSDWSTVESGGATKSLAFHPSYSYENFVVGLVPKPTAHGMGVEAVAGPLVQLAAFSQFTLKTSLLVLDEINRGNAAAIFGETLTLLDADKRDVETILLPYDSLSIRIPADATLATEERWLEGNEFTLPGNLWIVGAMNSSDRSAVPLDSALRRRFSVLFMPPDYETLTAHLGAKAVQNLSALNLNSKPEEIGALAVKMLKNINKRISIISGEDFELGQSLFWNIHISKSAPCVLDSIAAEWDSRIAPILRMNYRDDDQSLAGILGDTAEGLAYEWTEVPNDLTKVGISRLRLRRLEILDSSTKLKLFKMIAGA